MGTWACPCASRGRPTTSAIPIAAVEFSLDDGEHWTRYETPDTNDYQNVTWTFDYTPEKAGFYVLRVRSVNDAGEHSPESAFAELQVDD